MSQGRHVVVLGLVEAAGANRTAGSSISRNFSTRRADMRTRAPTRPRSVGNLISKAVSGTFRRAYPQAHGSPENSPIRHSRCSSSPGRVADACDSSPDLRLDGSPCERTGSTGDPTRACAMPGILTTARRPCSCRLRSSLPGPERMAFGRRNRPVTAMAGHTWTSAMRRTGSASRRARWTATGPPACVRRSTVSADGCSTGARIWRHGPPANDRFRPGPARARRERARHGRAAGNAARFGIFKRRDIHHVRPAMVAPDARVRIARRRRDDGAGARHSSGARHHRPRLVRRRQADPAGGHARRGLRRVYDGGISHRIWRHLEHYPCRLCRARAAIAGAPAHPGDDRGRRHAGRRRGRGGVLPDAARGRGPFAA